jgi:hypothetical protein
MRKPYLVLIILVGLLSAGAIGAAIIVSLQAQSKTDSLAPQVDGGTATCSGGNIDACNRICPSQASRLVIRDTEGHELRITCRRSNVTAKTPVREIPNTKEFIPINPANPNSAPANNHRLNHSHRDSQGLRSLRMAQQGEAAVQEGAEVQAAQEAQEAAQEGKLRVARVCPRHSFQC